MNCRKFAEKVLVQVGKLEDNLHLASFVCCGSKIFDLSLRERLPATINNVCRHFAMLVEPPCGGSRGAGPMRRSFVRSGLMQRRHRTRAQQ